LTKAVKYKDTGQAEKEIILIARHFLEESLKDKLCLSEIIPLVEA
jgi:hypothetical protein